MGPSHAIGNELGSAYEIPHGICSCLTLAPTLRLMSKLLPESNIDAQDLAICSREVVTSNSKGDKEAIVDLANGVEELVKSLGLKSSLGEYKVPKGEFNTIAKRIVARLNYCKYQFVPTEEQVVRIFKWYLLKFSLSYIEDALVYSLQLLLI